MVYLMFVSQVFTQTFKLNLQDTRDSDSWVLQRLLLRGDRTQDILLSLNSVSNVVFFTTRLSLQSK